ncbi:hypothetical protein BMW23_0471 [Bodo saltans virus]|uniref:Uncharacterized protein n=1 Tax=Bodo saltans virus TaxID=2024608 RepID=A0A2H4UUB0_9VIRU|nr:hypothetical protein QJ851_gp0460 [Bodo saltans virus]ATZ80523.1 hypothetical protein BMW23_0471 [Bodo saltans virus]
MIIKNAQLENYYINLGLLKHPIKKIQILNLPIADYTLQFNSFETDKSNVSINNIFDFGIYSHIVDMKPCPSQYKDYIMIPIATVIFIGVSNHYMSDEEKKMFIDFAKVDVAKIKYMKLDKMDIYEHLPDEKCKLLISGFEYPSSIDVRTADLCNYRTDLSKYRCDFERIEEFDIIYEYPIELKNIVKSIKCDNKFSLCADNLVVESDDNGYLVFTDLEKNVHGYLSLFPYDKQQKININIHAQYKNIVLDFNNVKKSTLYFRKKVGKSINFMVEYF